MKNFVTAHVVLRARYPYTPFKDEKLCSLTWKRMQKTFDQTLAAILMPNHLHLLVRESTLAAIEEKQRSIRKFLVRMSAPSTWDAVTAPELVPDRHHLKRLIRYIHLNPCRKGYCADPLEWLWSTHRDYVAAVADPWVDSKEVLTEIGFRSDRRGIEQFHTYVSGDPTVAIQGTPVPQRPRSPELIDLNVATLAAAAALRVPIQYFERKGAHRANLARALTHEMGARKSRVAQELGIRSRSIGSQRNAADRNLANAILLLMNDARFKLGR